MPTLSNEDLQAISLFGQMTGAHATDFLQSEDTVFFVVDKGDVGRAIRKQGANIERLRKAFGKPVELAETADSLDAFLRGIFLPAQIKDIKLMEKNGKKTVNVTVEGKDKGLAIGRGGARIKKARLLAKRQYDVEDVKIS